MSKNADPADSTEDCECVRQDDLHHNDPGDFVTPLKLNPEHTEYDIEGEEMRGLGSRPMRIRRSWVVEHRLQFGRGKGKLAKDASCDEIRDCLDHYVPGHNYVIGLRDCRHGTIGAMSACGLKSS